MNWRGCGFDRLKVLEHFRDSSSLPEVEVLFILQPLQTNSKSGMNQVKRQMTQIPPPHSLQGHVQGLRQYLSEKNNQSLSFIHDMTMDWTRSLGEMKMVTCDGSYSSNAAHSITSTH